MPCQVCSRQLLSLFLRHVASTPLPSTSAPLNRTFPTRSSQLVRLSKRFRTTDGATGKSETEAASFIPFEESREGLASASASNNGLANKVTPKASLSETSDDKSYIDGKGTKWNERIGKSNFQPEIEYEGDLKGVDPNSIIEQTKEAVRPFSNTTQEDASPVKEGKNARKKRRRRMEALASGQKVLPTKVAHKKDTTAKSPKKSKTQSKDKQADKAQDVKQKEPWQVQKEALKKKFAEEGWNPRKKLSPDALEGIRTLHKQYPDHFTTPVLAQHFKISPEVIRRVLKSKWRPSTEEEEDRRQRWERRGARIWEAKVELGVHAPKKWREMGIGTGRRRRRGESIPAKSNVARDEQGRPAGSAPMPISRRATN